MNKQHLFIRVTDHSAVCLLAAAFTHTQPSQWITQSHNAKWSVPFMNKQSGMSAGADYIFIQVKDCTALWASDLLDGLCMHKQLQIDTQPNGLCDVWMAALVSKMAPAARAFNHKSISCQTPVGYYPTSLLSNCKSNLIKTMCYMHFVSWVE